VPGPAQVRGDLAYADLGNRMYLPQRVDSEPRAPADVPGPAQVRGDLAYANFDKCVYQFSHAPYVPPHLDIADLGRVLDPLTCTQHPSTLYGRSSGLVWLPECDSSGQAGCWPGSWQQEAHQATYTMQPECRHFHQDDASWNPMTAIISLSGAVGHGGREVSRGARTMGNTVQGGFVGLFNAYKKAGSLMRRTKTKGEATSTGGKNNKTPKLCLVRPAHTANMPLLRFDTYSFSPKLKRA